MSAIRNTPSAYSEPILPKRVAGGPNPPVETPSTKTQVTVSAQTSSTNTPTKTNPETAILPENDIATLTGNPSNALTDPNTPHLPTEATGLENKPLGALHQQATELGIAVIDTEASVLPENPVISALGSKITSTLESSVSLNTLDPTPKAYESPMQLVKDHKNMATQQQQQLAKIDTLLLELEQLSPEDKQTLAPQIEQLKSQKEVLSVLQKTNAILGQDAGNDKKIIRDNNQVNPKLVGELKAVESELQNVYENLPEDSPLKPALEKNLNRLRASNLASSNSGYVAMKEKQTLDLHPASHIARYDLHVDAVEGNRRRDVDASPEGFVMAKVLEGKYQDAMLSHVETMGQDIDAFFKNASPRLPEADILAKRTAIMQSIDTKYGKVLDGKGVQSIKDMVNNRFDQALGSHQKRVEKANTDAAKVLKAETQVEFDPELSSFSEYINPLDSGGDNIEIHFGGQAGVGVGWFGVDVAGGVKASISKGDDEYFYMSFSANGEVGATAGKEMKVGGKTVGAEARLAAGIELGATYRFNSAKEASDFMAYQIRSTLPEAVVEEALPNLKKVPDMSHIQPTTRVAGYGKLTVSASTKLGKIDLSGKIEGQATFSTVKYPNGNVGNDQSYAGRFAVKVNSFSVSGQLNNYTVNNNPIPENNGEYLAFEGAVSFTLSKDEMKALSENKAADMMAKVEGMGINLGLKGKALSAFQEGVFNRVMTAVDKNEANGKKSSITLSIGVQAQWEVADKGKENPLQYFRLGAGTAAEFEAGFDYGVVEASFNAGYSNMDYQNMALGNEDITYVQGLFFAPDKGKAYHAAKADLGGDQAVVQGKTLAAWESEWKSANYNRATEALR